MSVSLHHCTKSFQMVFSGYGDVDHGQMTCAQLLLVTVKRLYVHLNVNAELGRTDHGSDQLQRTCASNNEKR